MHEPPLLISLPHGLNASGVTRWAVRLVNALSAEGRRCGLVVHDEPPGQRPIALEIDPGVEVFDARGLPPMDACDGDLECYMPVYRLACAALGAGVAAPVVFVPGILGDCFGVGAALTGEMPGRVRVLAVHHSDTRYNDRIIERYLPVLSAIVGVSDTITERLRARWPARATDIFGIACGVEVGEEPPRREAVAGRPLRLAFAGRLDHEQKRVGSLAHFVDGLGALGIPHELAVFGDGPSGPALERAAAARPSIRLFGAVGPERVASALAGADLFVLPSRYEGLSVALLEAMAAGAVPLVTPSASGTAQLVIPGETGLLADAGPEADERCTGAALAEAVARLVGGASGRGAWLDGALQRMRTNAWRLVRQRFNSGLTARRYGAVIDRVARAPGRVWQAGEVPAFTGPGGRASATVPSEAPERMWRVLERLAGRSIAVWGAGRHTVELRETFARAPVRIAAFIDDDAARHGRELWGVPVVDGPAAAGLGASDVVISSWLHHDEMWSRRERLEASGLSVHPVYETRVPA